MRVTSVLFVLCAMVAIATGQWIDRVLSIPDSMFGIAGSDRMLVEAATGRLWFAGFDAYRVQVYDPSAGAKVTVIAGEEGEIAGVAAFAQSAVSHRVYIAGYPLTVVDDRDYSVKAQYNISGARMLAYDSRDDKMYTTMTFPDSLILVYKPGPDTLIGSLDIGGSIRTLVYDSVRNRLFAVRESADIAVFDCATDSLVTYLPVSGQPVWDLALDQVARRLYSATWRTPAGNDIWVYDADSLHVLDTISLPSEWNLDDVTLTLNPATNRLYGYYGSWMKNRDWIMDSVAVVDCSSRAVSFVAFPDGYGVARIVPAGAKAYAAAAYSSDSVAVLGVPDSITDWLGLTDQGPVLAGWNPNRNEVYIVDYDDQLRIVDAGSDSVVRTVDYSRLIPYWFFWNPSGKMYGGSHRELAAFGADGSLLFRYLGRDMFREPPAWSPQLNRFYFTNRYYTIGDTLCIWDCAGDSMVGRRELPAAVESLWAVPGRNRVYLPTGSQVFVYDTYADSVVGSIPAAVRSFAYNPRNGLVYGFAPRADSVQVIDPSCDSVIATLSANGAEDIVVNTRDNEVYVSEGSMFYVFNGTTHEKVGQYPLPGGGSKLFYVEDWNQLVAIGSTVGWAYDCPARQKNRVFTVPSRSWSQFIWNSRNDKLYVLSYWTDSTLAVVRLPWDTVVAEIKIPFGLSMGWNPIANETYVSNLSNIYVVRDEMTGIDDAGAGVAGPLLRVEQNPSAGSVRFACAASAPAQLQVYDMTGRLVWHRMLSAVMPGVVWDRTDLHGKAAPRGVYVARLAGVSDRATAKVVLE